MLMCDVDVAFVVLMLCCVLALCLLWTVLVRVVACSGVVCVCWCV